jgi:GT2 family glycosyltransferase
MKVTAILACHNRRDRTLECLASYYAQHVPASVELSAVVVDDGSTDGTAEAVHDRYPVSEVIHGDGGLYWGAGMALAESRALLNEPDHLLWLNDDVVLDSEALARLLRCVRRNRDGCIAVGAVRDPRTGRVTYSGIRRRGIHPLRVKLVEPATTPVEVEMFNGNVVLVPRAASMRAGLIDGQLGHRAADFDYALRAARVGVRSVLVPGTVGTCPRNEGADPWRDTSLSLAQRLRLFLGPKGFPPRARARYLVRHGGPAWIVFWLAPYVRAAPSFARTLRVGGSRH